MLQFVLKEIKTEGEMHRLETETLLPSLATFTVWPTPNQEGMRICFGSQLREPGASGRKKQTAVSPQTPGKRACNAGTYPLVPESRTPAYRMVSPTCRVFHPQLIKTQRHPQNIPRCLSPRWSETQVLTMKKNHSEHHPRKSYFIKRTGKPVGLQENSGDVSAEEWHFHTCI